MCIYIYLWAYFIITRFQIGWQIDNHKLPDKPGHLSTPGETKFGQSWTLPPAPHTSQQYGDEEFKGFLNRGPILQKGVPVNDETSGLGTYFPKSILHQIKFYGNVKIWNSIKIEIAWALDWKNFKMLTPVGTIEAKFRAPLKRLDTIVLCDVGGGPHDVEGSQSLLQVYVWSV